MFPSTSRLPSEALYAVEIKRQDRHELQYLAMGGHGTFDGSREALEANHETFVGSQDQAMARARQVAQGGGELEFVRVVRLSRWVPFPVLSVFYYQALK